MKIFENKLASDLISKFSGMSQRIAASAGIWTGLDLTWWWTMSKNCTECDHLHWQCQLGKVSAYCFQRFYSWPQIDVATGSWNWGPSGKWRVGALELNNTPTTMLQPTHLKIHLDMFPKCHRHMTYEFSQHQDPPISDASTPRVADKQLKRIHWYIAGTWFGTFLCDLYCPTRLTEYRSVFF